ncbi:serpin-ZX-like protein [Tanacetum coccineum]
MQHDDARSKNTRLGDLMTYDRYEASDMLKKLVWVEKTLSLKPSFKQVLETVYNAASNQVDFQNKAAEITNKVNLWAHQQTNGLIKEILPVGAVDDTTRLIFVNAVYFKGAWNEMFDLSKTKDYDFHLLDGSKVQVPFMTSKKKQFMCEYDGFKVLRLPYSQGEDERHFTMYFFLPNEKDGLPQLIRKIASDMLKELGLVLPFIGKEGLNEMVDNPSMGQNLYVSSIHHKSFIEVNEEGTEAAAVTAGIVMLMSLRRPDVKVDFVADHPFFFVIREDISGVVLFMGQVIDTQVLDSVYNAAANQADELAFSRSSYSQMQSISKGGWNEKFKTRDTKHYDFHLLDGRSGYQQKGRKPSQNDKTEHGMEKTVQNQGQSPKMTKTVKTKWALNQLQQPICVHLTKTVKTLKAQS